MCARVGLKGHANPARALKNYIPVDPVMKRFAVLLLPLALLVAACTTPPASQPTLGPDGRPLPKLYRIPAGAEGRIQFRVLDSVNSLRSARGLQEVELNAKLNAAAATHARDMSVQNRPWHFGSDGSSPIDRVRRVGYSGRMLGEAISETYETELETLAAWMEEPGTREIIMAPEARDLGFAYFQEPNGKIWWTLVMGARGQGGVSPAPALSSVEEIAGPAIDLVDDAAT